METKNKILGKASEMFVSLGVRNVTMDTLAGELGISKRTIYELFNDKDALVIECIRHIIVENNKGFLKIIESSENVVEAMFQIIRIQKENRQSYPKVFTEDIKRYYPLVQASFYSSKHDLEKFSATFTLLEKGRAQGIFRTDLRTDLVDNFIHEIISIVHTSDRIRLLNPSDTDLISNIMLPYFRGICTPKGLELMIKYFEEINN
ncbi:MAG: TetR/AcrR family transcriptional regulator [Bacteroidales bacterium]|nr:TetR/AcrR family transcriptional regulator [Bacteroidales bacterium]